MTAPLLRTVRIGVGLLVLTALGLAVEVQLARTAPRLDDEEGARPARAVVRPGPDPLHVVWLGDSTTTGVGTTFETSMAWLVTERLTDGPALVTVLGRSGDQVHEVLGEQLPRLDDVRDAHVVLVSIGANDVTALTRRPTFEGRYETMVDAVTSTLPEALVVLVGIPDMGTAPRLPVPLRQIAGLRASQLDDVIAGVARRAELHHVELADRTSGTFSSDPDRYFSDDDFHPSADGHRVWADGILDSLADADVAIPEP